MGKSDFALYSNRSYKHYHFGAMSNRADDHRSWPSWYTIPEELVFYHKKDVTVVKANQSLRQKVNRTAWDMFFLSRNSIHPNCKARDCKARVSFLKTELSVGIIGSLSERKSATTIWQKEPVVLPMSHQTTPLKKSKFSSEDRFAQCTIKVVPKTNACREERRMTLLQDHRKPVKRHTICK